MVDRHSAALDLGEFLIRRLDERAAGAARAGDHAGQSFVMGSRAIMQKMCIDLVERPWAHHEIEAYLLRSARQYRFHPEYKSWWD